jgi:hypothetical protein
MYEQLPDNQKGVVSLYKAMNVASCTTLGSTLATYVLLHHETQGVHWLRDRLLEYWISDPKLPIQRPIHVAARFCGIF